MISAIDSYCIALQVGMLLACAYPDRVAQRRDRGSTTGSATAFLLCSGRGVTFPQRSVDPMASEGAPLPPASSDAKVANRNTKGWARGDT
jgi:hypothetical protein